MSTQRTILGVATRCFTHGKPRIELPPGTKVHHFYTDCIEGLQLCVCGSPWSHEDDSQAIRDMPDHSTIYERDLWMRKRLGIKTPVKSVKAAAEDVSARWYFITLTSPDTVRTPFAILINTCKILKSKMLAPISWCYCLELTEKGTPHSHIAVYTEKYPEYKKIGKFNASPEGAQWRYDIQQEKWNVKNYIQKVRSKPTSEWLASYGLESAVFYSDNFPEELKSQADVDSIDLISYA